MGAVYAYDYGSVNRPPEWPLIATASMTPHQNALMVYWVHDASLVPSVEDLGGLTP
jgi:hypothetical protein